MIPRQWWMKVRLFDVENSDRQISLELELTTLELKQMKKISIAFAATLALMTFAGCKKKGGDMGQLAKDVCACKDMACAQDVQKKFAEKQGGGDKAADTKEPSDDDKKAMKEMTDCMTKLASSGAGGDMKGGDMKGGDKPAGDMKDDKKPDGDKPAGGDMKADSTGVKECD